MKNIKLVMNQEVKKDTFNDKITQVDDALKQERYNINQKIKSLNEKMKNLREIPNLQMELYAFKQDIVDLYYKTLNTLANLTKTYKGKYSATFMSYKNGNNPKQPNVRPDDKLIDMLTETDLAGEGIIIKLIDNQCKYIKDTIKNIDDIIWGIKNRIELEKLITGLI